MVAEEGGGRYTHRSLPPPWLSPAETAHAKSPFVPVSMGNYFLSVDYGVNFRTTRPDHFERDTALVRDIREKGCPGFVTTTARSLFLLLFLVG